MEINQLIDCLNKKISGLCTIALDTNIEKQGFTNRPLFKYTVYRCDYPEGARTMLQKFESTDIGILEADVVEWLFDLLISERYREWKNYALVRKNIEWLERNFLK